MSKSEICCDYCGEELSRSDGPDDPELCQDCLDYYESEICSNCNEAIDIVNDNTPDLCSACIEEME